VIELGKEKSHSVSVQIELRRLPSHFSIRLRPYGYGEESSLLTSVCGEVESKDAFMIGRPLKHFGMAQGTDYVVIPGTPMVLHAPTRELVILRRPLVTLGAVDEMDDVVDLSISHIPEQRRLRRDDRTSEVSACDAHNTYFAADNFLTRHHVFMRNKFWCADAGQPQPPQPDGRRLMGRKAKCRMQKCANDFRNRRKACSAKPQLGLAVILATASGALAATKTYNVDPGHRVYINVHNAR
jgi:hypothetical protein